MRKYKIELIIYLVVLIFFLLAFFTYKTEAKEKDLNNILDEKILKYCKENKLAKEKEF
jgi:protein-S-isoprenylcysteine O-methyltransferase Ste14